MKVRIKQETPQFNIDEIFTGPNAEAIVAAMKSRVASELSFALRLMVNAMSPLGFAQEVVKRYAEFSQKTIPPPRSCEEFLEFGEREGVVTVLEP